MSNAIAGGGRWPSPKKENGKIVRGRQGMKANSVPGGSMPPSSRGPDGKLTRKDLHMRRAVPSGALTPALAADGTIVREGEARAFGTEGSISDQTGISIFDPTLCELIYTWFCPKPGTILDPFAGGSVRGIVASKLGRRYHGIDLRQEQVDANQEQASEICSKDIAPTWYCGDSLNVADLITAREFDMLFTCPPYADLEVYSDDPRDISTMAYDKFMATYEAILMRSVALLAPNRFAAVVVGEVRNKKTGFYRGFVPDTIRAMEKAGAGYYNEIILVTAVGSLPLRAGRTFEATRKIGKTHQNILVFCKGDPKLATKACGPLDGAISAEE